VTKPFEQAGNIERYIMLLEPKLSNVFTADNTKLNFTMKTD
jgi:hypothetical protein